MTQTEERNYLRHILNIDTSLQSIAKSLKQIAENTKPNLRDKVLKAMEKNVDPDPRSEEEIKRDEELAKTILFGDGSRENPEV